LVLVFIPVLNLKFLQTLVLQFCEIEFSTLPITINHT
jgi:hypothetical protein